ncbi:MAG TPA: DNA polymerase I, partial [Clostridiaceae bacterium]|nr:DNA polymerase I [Clostridiaceae bacterium]
MKFDTAIASYLLNPSESTYGVDELTRKYMNESIPSEKEVKEMMKSGEGMDIARDYLCTKAIYVYRLYDVLSKKLEDDGMKRLYEDVEHPLIEVLASMEIEGFTVDRKILEELSGEFGDEIDILTSQIYDLA